jgi:hypothetical protein
MTATGSAAWPERLWVPPPPPKPQYISIEVSGSCCVDATWKIGNGPETTGSTGSGTYTVWHGWLKPGITVQATVTDGSPIPPWRGPTTDTAYCYICTGRPWTGRFADAMPQPVMESLGSYQAPTMDAIYGTPAQCSYTVGSLYGSGMDPDQEPL